MAALPLVNLLTMLGHDLSEVAWAITIRPDLPNAREILLVGKRLGGALFVLAYEDCSTDTVIQYSLQSVVRQSQATH